MIYKSVSVKYVIADILNQLQLTSSNRIDDMIEWVGQAMDAIGCHTEFTLKSESLEVADHRVALPCDLYRVQQISYYDEPLQYGSQTFNYSIHCNNCVNETSTSKDTYIINNGYIRTSFEDGDICVIYQAFPTDSEGFPLVPDNYSFNQAFLWYVMMKLMMGSWQHPNKEITFTYVVSRWNWYCSQARNAAKMPDIDRMEDLQNQWVRTIPNMNAWQSFFSELNNREQLDRRAIKSLMSNGS